MAHETRLESHFEYGKNAPKVRKPLPRCEHGHLIVANHSTLPKMCVQTGSTQNLRAVAYTTSSGGVLMFLLGGPVAFLIGRRRATIHCSIERTRHAKLQRNVLLSSTLLVLSILSIACAFVFSRFFPFALGIVGSLSASILFHTKATPFRITNIWDDEVFIGNLNPVLVETMLASQKTVE